MSSQIEHRVSSQIQRIVRDGRAVFEKKYITNDWDDDATLIRARAQREVDLLHQISKDKQFGHRLGIVRVAAADPTAATISTYEIAGISLGQFIHEGDNVATNLIPWFLAGRWLRQFQSLRISDEMPDIVSRRDPTDIVDYCDFRLRSFAECGYSWPTETARKALLQTIETLRDRREDAETTRVWVHADYAPGNLMWDGHMLTPIDFAMVRTGTPLDDATYLIHRLEMQKIYRPWLRLPVSAIRRAILRGLGRPAADQSAAYQMLMIKHQICRYHTYARRPAKNFKQALHDRWVRSVLLRQLQQITKATSN